MNEITTMTEDYLHYIWKYKLFDSNELITVDGDKLDIVNFGIHNHNSGPDFSEGKVKIEDTLWAGNIEIHINSSDWLKHNHQSDKAYNSVVLHVVYNYDKEIKTTSGAIIPTLELKNRLNYSDFENYNRFIFNPIPCIQLLDNVPEITISSHFNQMIVERLEMKTDLIKEQLEALNYDWEQVFFQQLAKSLGMKVNAFGMEEMANIIPYKIFAKLGNNKLAIESLLFGQAGFLEQDLEENEYHKSLSKEYQFYQQKNSLTPINKQSWKFSKMRPSNFPTLRLAQLAKLLSVNGSLFNSFIKKDISYDDIVSKLGVELNSGFWHTHYTFETECKPIKKSIGKTLINSIIINTIVPFMYLYGSYKDDMDYKEKALDILEDLPAEENKITRFFSDKIRLNSAADTQGIIHCHNNYCLKKRCLDCGIGIHILK